jgi:Tol biopolymer transport system component
MGEVWKAKDTRLGRDVAIKVLAGEFFEDKERVARFEREATLLAALNHPNIAAIYSFEETPGSSSSSPSSRHFLVMELLVGETLRERLRDGALPLRKALEIAVQVAQGLSAAHEAGIVHRDLKPENTFLTKDGRVKILDFGLAKPAAAGGRENLTTDGTESVLTDAGTVMGTVNYMAPEQLKGESADRRTDLFSFGVVLHEMLSGLSPFRRTTPAETMSAILREDPPALPESTPPGLALLVRHALEKNPGDRFQSARDLGFALEALSSLSGPAKPADETIRGRRRPSAVVLAVGALVAAALLVAAFAVGRRASVAPVVTFKRLTFQRGRILSARFAPDGQTILYAASWEGRKPEIYSTRIDSTESRPLGIPDVSDVFSVSASAELLVQHRTADGKDALAQVPLSGGAPRDLVEGATNASWAPDGKAFAVLFGEERRADSSGPGKRLEFPEGRVLFSTRDGLSAPAVSPDGRHVAFLSRADIYAGFCVEVVDTAGKRRTLSKNWNFVFPSGLSWSPKGDEIWFAGDREGGTRWLNAVSLDGRERVVTHLPDDVYLHDVFRDGRVLLAREVRRHSLIVLPPGGASERDLSWLDYSGLSGLTADGRQVSIVEFGEGGGSTYSTYLRKTDGSPAVKIMEGAGPLSPDGRFVFGVQRAQPLKAFIAPTGPGAKREVPLGRVVAMNYCEWFPDGRSLIFMGREAEGGTRLYTCDAVNPAEPRAITPEGFSLGYASLPVSPDGTTLFAKDEKGRPVLIPVGGGPAREIPGVLPGDEPMQWMDGGKTLLVKRPGTLSLAVYRLDLATGARTLFRELAPQDLAGLSGFASARFTPDGRSYGYSYFRTLSDLYLVEGLK